MIDYKLKYLKYKEKYLIAKSKIINFNDFMNEINETYQLIASHFKEVYLTGESAIFALAFFIEKKLIPKKYPLPKSIDFIVFQIGSFEKDNDNLLSTTAFSTSEDRILNSFTVATTPVPLKHHVIDHNGNNIKIHNINKIEVTENSVKQKLLINKINRFFNDRNTQISLEYNPVYKEKKNFGLSEKDFTVDLAQPINPKTDSTTSEELAVPIILNK